MSLSVLLAQQAPPPREHQLANESFFGWYVAGLLAAAIALTAFLAWRRARMRPSALPAFDDANFEEEVLAARTPVIVHFARAWNVANRAALAQTELLAWQNRGFVKVGTLDVDANPRTLALFPDLEPPAYVLFHRGRKLWHRPGLRQAGELQQDVDAALSREGFSE